jgi:hypothetical protein
MVIGDLKGWPPAPSDPVGLAPRPNEGIFLGCRFIPSSGQTAAHVEIHILHQRRQFTVSYARVSEPMLSRVAHALNRHVGIDMSRCAGLPLFG